MTSLCEKLSEIFTGSGVVPSKGQTFLEKQVKMIFGQQPLPVKLFKILYALGQECEKSMLQTASHTINPVNLGQVKL